MKTTIRYVFTLAALLLSSSSFADYYNYRITHSPAVYNAPTPEAVCIMYLDTRSDLDYISNTETKCKSTYPFDPYTWEFNITKHLVTGTCPAPYEQEGLYCQLPSECPDGQFMEGGVCTIGCSAGASVKQVLYIENIKDNMLDPNLGCNLEIDTTKSPECNFNTFMCNVYYKDTGVYNPDFSYDNGQPPEPEPEPEISPEPVTTETVDGPITETANNPDGSTTTTETTTTTKVNDQGHLVEIIGDSIVLKNQAGEIIEILQQFETNTYTDGSSQVTETVTTTATPNSITEVKKNLIDGSTTVTTRTYNTGLTGTTTTTKTTNYDSTGKQTGSTTVSSGNVSETDGSGSGGGGEEGGELCGAPGQPICDVKIHEDQSDYDQHTQQIETLETEYTTMMDDFLELDTADIMGVSDMDWTSADYWIANFLNIPMTTNCTGVISSSIFGRPFVLDPCERLIPLREILAWVFSIMTFFAILHIIFHRKLL